MRYVPLILVFACVAPTTVQGQDLEIGGPDGNLGIAPVTSAWVDGWSIRGGHLGTYEQRVGVGVAIGGRIENDEVRLALRYTPEGAVEPGWIAVTLETARRIEFQDVFLGGRLAAGGLKMNVANRHSIISECRLEDGCMFEAEAFAAGWSSVGGLEVLLGVMIGRGLELHAGYGVHGLISGSNRGEILPGWSVAAHYRMPRGVVSRRLLRHRDALSCASSMRTRMA